ncbi:hypothetical protein SLA2020_261760 [Shorea laevis]
MDVIWFTRNQAVHNNSYKLDITSLLKQINITVKSHLQAWKNKLPTRSLWKPPPLGFLKANFDLAIRSKFSVASVLNIDETEMVIAACSWKLDSTKVIVHGGSICNIPSYQASFFPWAKFRDSGKRFHHHNSGYKQPTSYLRLEIESIIRDIFHLLFSFPSCKASKFHSKPESSFSSKIGCCS